MKERVTLTLSGQLVRRIDSMVDGYEVKNRSHAVELLLIKSLGTNVPKKILVLAGGGGSKVSGPKEVPKALIKINNRNSSEYLFDFIKKYDIRDVIMAVGHMKESIKEEFGDGRKYGVNILYLEEEQNLGTAGPLKLGKHLFNEPFIVCHSDIIIDLDLEEMFRLHKNRNALVTVALTTIDDPTRFGVARLSGSKILEFVEKPKKNEAPSNLISAGFYIIDPLVLEMIPKGVASLEYDIFPKLAKQGKLIGYPFSGDWFDISLSEFYKLAKKNL